MPVFNESENILSLIDEINHALEKIVKHEILYVDDGSTDNTLNVLKEKQKSCPHLRILHHKKSCGQSYAIHTGITSAQAPWIATLDGDGQNVPADIPELYQKAIDAKKEDKIWLIAGWRQSRKDNWLKLKSSRYANAIRGWMLKDKTPDTGCGLKVFRRDVFLKLPAFNHMHRYLPALFQRSGGQVINVKVSHRAREKGISKYGFWNRAIVGIYDLIGVSWLIRRGKIPVVIEINDDK